MNRARVLAVSALTAGLLLIVVVLSCSGTTKHVGQRPRSTALTIGDPLTEALRYVPRSAGLVAVVQTDATRGPLAAALALARTLPGGGALLRQAQALVDGRTGLSLADEEHALAGAPAVLARVGGPGHDPRMLGAWVVPSAAALGELLSARAQSGELLEGPAIGLWATYRQSGGRFLAARDRVLLLATDTATLREAISRRLRTGRGGGLTPAAFTTLSRAGMPAGQPVLRVAADGPSTRALLTDRIPGAAGLAWVKAVTGAGVAIAADGDGLHVRARLRTDEASLVEPDVPIALGPVAPALTGDAPVVVGLRDPARTIAVAVELLQTASPARASTYAQLRASLKRYAGVDLDADVIGALKDDGTLTFPEGGGVTLRATVNDDQALRDALGRLGRVGQLAGIAGALGVGPDTGGLAIDTTGGDRYEVRLNDATVAVVALRDGVFVASTDPAVDVDAVAGAGPGDPGAAAPGALHAVLTPDALAGLVVDRLGGPASVRSALSALGPTTVSARAELSFLEIRADVAAGQAP